jgi:nucleoside-diphosphate-sugar epimerase
MFSHVDRELPFYPPGANGVVDVRDVARAVMLLLRQGEDGDRYLLNGHNISYRDLMVQIATALGRKAPRLPMQRWQARLLLAGEAIRSRILRQPALLTPETVRNSFQHFSYNNERSRRQLQLNYTPIEQTIRETAAQYLEAQQQQRAFGLLPLL